MLHLTNHQKSALIGLFVLFAAASVGLNFSPETHAQEQLDAPSSDILAYVSRDNHLIFYNPQTHTETVILDDVATFKLSPDGRVAYIPLAPEEDEISLYIFDPAAPDVEPILIDQPNAFPLQWSQDGRYLALSVLNGNMEELYVWDGENTVNVMPNEPLNAVYRFELHWSPDGHLAFTIVYGYSSLSVPSELYIWDGDSTFNLSQNPNTWDSPVHWRSDGRLLFSSQREGWRELYIWDGAPPGDDATSHNTLVQITSELEDADPVWVKANLIAFRVTSGSEETLTQEAVIWDMDADVIIERLPVTSQNIFDTFSPDGQFLVSTWLASGIPSIYLDVEDRNGSILLSEQTGELSWSQHGYLAYCGIENGMSEVLIVWDGEESRIVTRVSYRPVQWQTSTQTFYCNNG